LSIASIKVLPIILQYFQYCNINNPEKQHVLKICSFQKGHRKQRAGVRTPRTSPGSVPAGTTPPQDPRTAHPAQPFGLLASASPRNVDFVLMPLDCESVQEQTKHVQEYKDKLLHGLDLINFLII